MRALFLLPIVATLTFPLATVTRAAVHCDSYCRPGSSCWPSLDQMLELYKNIKGTVYDAYNKEYHDLVVMINTRVTKLPYFIVMAATVDDVIFALKFANKYNIKITIRSSGHDYIGRATGDGTLQIHLGNMTNLKFNLNSNRNVAGELTAQSGNTWLRVYNETSKIGRVIVGGSAHTVSMGGYTLGGGHSPIGRKFGLAIDNLLEVEMVSPDGMLMYFANGSGTTEINTETGHTFRTSDSDIFWAVRGGGGSTFGIVTAFTFKLHYDSKMVRMVCYSPVFDAQGHDVGRPLLQTFDHLASTSLAPEWGGYEIITSGSNPNASTRGTILFVLNHFGEWGSPSFHTIDPFLSKFATLCSFQNVSNFLEYEIQAQDALYYRTYIFNSLLQPDTFTPEYYNFMYNMFQDPALPILQTGMGCTGTLIGGKMNIANPNSTAMNPNFRTGVMSMSCGMAWGSAFDDKPIIELAEKFTAGFIKHGKGTYFNEPSAYLPNWKIAYWGGHYDRLLAIKQRLDPKNLFKCLHCVGSDTNTTEGTTNSIPDIHFPYVIG